MKTKTTFGEVLGVTVGYLAAIALVGVMARLVYWAWEFVL